MRKTTLLFGALLGGITSLPIIALLFLGEQLARLPFVPFDVFDWLTRVLPGAIVTFGIDLIVGIVRFLDIGRTDTTAKLAEQLLALSLTLAGGVVFGALIAWSVARSRRPGWQIGAIGGAIVFVGLAAIELSLGLSASPVLALLWLALIIVVWGTLLGDALSLPDVLPVSAPTKAQSSDRRNALLKIAGGSIGITLGAWGLGAYFKNQEGTSGAGQPLAGLARPTPPPEPPATPTADATYLPEGTPRQTVATATPRPQATTTTTGLDRLEPVPGTRSELTATEEFYRVDINTRPVVIEGQAWTLQVEGLFDHPRPLSLEDLMAFPAVTQPITLGCISNQVGGDLISTGNWTGLRLGALLQDLGLQPQAQELFIEAEDGFYESVAMADMMDPRTLLVYGMNGETLPVEHGFPLRIYIPNRYGMKQPKWITRIEAIAEKGEGYWVDRGWSAEARPQIVSVIDAVAEAQAANGMIPIGGIAWAGDRGIQKVEVQVDYGEWVEADLRTPPLGPLTWVQWRYDWPAVPGRRLFTVRATDGSGALQIEEKQSVRPDGATGYHSVRATIPEV